MKKTIVFISTVLLAACSSGDEMPKDILPITKMKTIIWELSLADNMASDKYVINRDSQRIMATGLYGKIFSLHKINKAGFYKSYAYYEAHPAQMQVLFDSVNAYGMREKTNVFKKD